MDPEVLALAQEPQAVAEWLLVAVVQVVPLVEQLVQAEPGV